MARPLNITNYNNNVSDNEIAGALGGFVFDVFGDGQLSTPSDPVFDFGSGDFTLEMFIGPANTNITLIDFRDGTGQDRPRVYFDTSNIRFYRGETLLLTSTNGIPRNGRDHIAVTRKDGTLKIWIDGIEQGSVTDNTVYTQGPCSIAASYDRSEQYDGQFNEVRISRVARYVENFSVPTTEFTDDVYNSLLIHSRGPQGNTTYTDDYDSNAILEPESGLSLTTTISQSGNFANNLTRSTPTVFGCDVLFPSNPTDGVLFELGGQIVGCWVGIRDSGNTFRLRASDGSTSVSGSTTNTAVLDITDFPKDDQVYTVVWEFYPSEGRIRFWIERELKGTAFTTNNGPMRDGLYAGSDAGSYILAPTSYATVGEPTTAWPGSSPGSLRVYSHQVVYSSFETFQGSADLSVSSNLTASGEVSTPQVKEFSVTLDSYFINEYFDGEYFIDQKPKFSLTANAEVLSGVVKEYSAVLESTTTLSSTVGLLVDVESTQNVTANANIDAGRIVDPGSNQSAEFTSNINPVAIFGLDTTLTAEATTNAVNSRIRGFDVDITSAFSPNITVYAEYAGVALLEADFDFIAEAVADLSGRAELENIINLSLQSDWLRGFDAQLNASASTSVTPTRIVDVSADLEVTSTLEAAPISEFGSAFGITTDLEVTTEVLYSAAADLTTETNIDIDSTAYIGFDADFNVDSTLSVDAKKFASTNANLNATTTLNALTGVSVVASSNLTANTTVTANLQRVKIIPELTYTVPRETRSYTIPQETRTHHVRRY